MIVLTATMWPLSSQAQSYEVFNATISNTSSDLDPKESYSAHVLSRPNEFLGLSGFEADIEVRDHVRANGLTPLLISVLCAAASDDPDKGVFIPPSRSLKRLTLKDVVEYEQTLKGRQ